MEYLDFGSSSDSEQEDGNGLMYEMDSDEEEQAGNRQLLKMLELQHQPSKSQRNIQDFEAEMEAELDRRAFEIELQGGVEHQKSLSRSSSTTSLNKSPRASPTPGSSSGTTTQKNKKSSLKRRISNDPDRSDKKSVKFSHPPVTGSSGETNAEPEDSRALSRQKAKEGKAKKMYDELYFDSDESDGEDGSKKNSEGRKRFMTDDELFYDPSSDANDQAWIDDQRRKSYGHQESHSHSTSSSINKADGLSPSANNSTGKTTPSDRVKSSPSTTVTVLPKTDAVLNCPACFTTVCHDCQRHELYVGQYRAMFVVNCYINTKETLNVPEKAPKKFRKRTKAREQTNFTSTSISDVFHPVLCRVCKTQVAMYDSEEVYHFFNVLASQP